MEFAKMKTFAQYASPNEINGLRFALDMTGTHPEKRLIGYARVSTYGQTLDSQLEQLRKAGCSSRNIYREKVTGARADRRELPDSAPVQAGLHPMAVEFDFMEPNRPFRRLVDELGELRFDPTG